ncbi:MAG: polysaccharide biosynthesis/export family protein [Cyclobacterium sp.]|uniref:polysaccharide biosynthesis/export family protein n=1 Tax=unclassified Cyclobacterium TaxID=2615055 RepID=UPI001F091776|nr:polysaccharide biosynthesis/export family protein [Cyclobacterium sp. SYSU L10401]
MKPLFLTGLMALIFLGACSTRNLIYMSDLHQEDVNIEKIRNSAEPRIQPIDLLSITVSTLNPESNLLFNSGVLANIGSTAGQANVTSQLNEGYRVDNNGEISFPIIGKIKLAGLTLEEATDKMVKLLETEARNPIVNIKIINFRITVVGEVNNPSTISVPSEKINVIEAIGLAGDMTPFGKRENILLMREVGDERITARLNLNDKAILDSPYFYLQQNDILYVEPDKARALQTNTSRINATFILTLINTLTFIAWNLGLLNR